MLKPSLRIPPQAWLVFGAIASGVAPAAQTAHVRVNGVPFALQSRVLDGAPEALAQRLDGRWGQRLAAPGDDARAAAAVGFPARAPRRVLGRQRGPFHETLSLLPGPRAGTTMAIVAVQDLRRPPTPLPIAPLPLPAGARLLNVVQFGDVPGASALFSAGAGETPSRLAGRLAQQARAAGWQVSDLTPPGGVAGAGFWARRGARELSVVATADGRGARLQMLHVPGLPERPW